LCSYAPYLWNTEFVGLGIVAFVVLVMAIITLTDLVFTLYPNVKERILKPEGDFKPEQENVLNKA
jgi:hypothetical protein